MALFEIIIPEKQPAARLDAYLFHALPELPPKAVREAFSHRDVKMNGIRVKPEAKLIPGALVQVYTAAAPQDPFQVVYEDGQVLIVNKPAGISVDEDPAGEVTMAQLAARREARLRPENPPPALCHRLDHQTCGLLVFAKTKPAKETLFDAFKERKLQKTYTCLVKHTPEQKQAVLKAYLLKDAQKARVTIWDRPIPGALPILTGYRVAAPGEICRLEVDLITGRTHQIRAHMAHMGHPILGDDVYGDRTWNKEQKCRRLCLCANRLTFWAGGALAYLDGKTFETPVTF